MTIVCPQCNKIVWDIAHGEVYGGDFCTCLYPAVETVGVHEVTQLQRYDDVDCQACRAKIEAETKRKCWEWLEMSLWKPADGNLPITPYHIITVEQYQFLKQKWGIEK